MNRRIRCSTLILFVFVIVVSLINLACEKEVSEAFQPAQLIPDGIYKGMFSAHYYENDSLVMDSTWVSFKDGGFVNPSNPSLFPLGGQGKYQVYQDSLKFLEHSFWPGVEDENTILRGSYTYEVQNGHLIFYKYAGHQENLYKYDLCRE